MCTEYFLKPGQPPPNHGPSNMPCHPQLASGELHEVILLLVEYASPSPVGNLWTYKGFISGTQAYFTQSSGRVSIRVVYSSSRLFRELRTMIHLLSSLFARCLDLPSSKTRQTSSAHIGIICRFRPEILRNALCDSERTTQHHSCTLASLPFANRWSSPWRPSTVLQK